MYDYHLLKPPFDRYAMEAVRYVRSFSDIPISDSVLFKMCRGYSYWGRATENKSEDGPRFIVRLNENMLDEKEIIETCIHELLHTILDERGDMIRHDERFRCYMDQINARGEYNITVSCECRVDEEKKRRYFADLEAKTIACLGPSIPVRCEFCGAINDYYHERCAEDFEGIVVCSQCNGPIILPNAAGQSFKKNDDLMAIYAAYPNGVGSLIPALERYFEHAKDIPGTLKPGPDNQFLHLIFRNRTVQNHFVQKCLAGDYDRKPESFWLDITFLYSCTNGRDAIDRYLAKQDWANAYTWFPEWLRKEES